MKWIKLYNRPNSVQRAQDYAKAMGNPFKKYFGTGIFNWMNVFHDGTSDYYVDEEEIRYFEKYALKKLVEETKFYKFIDENYVNQFLEHEKYLRKLYKKDLSALQTSDLIKLFQKYKPRIVNCLSYMWLIAICEKPMEEALKIILKKYISEEKIEYSIKTVFSQTTDNYLSEEENELYRILKINDDMIKNNNLKKHTEKYKIISMYDYDHNPYTIDYFKDRLNNLDIKKVIENQKRIKENKKKFDFLINSINFSNDDKIKINGLNFLYNFKDQRSWFRSLDSFFGREIFFEISKRTGIKIKHILFLQDEELVDLININKKEFNFSERVNFCLFIFSENNPKLLLGKKAKDYLNINLESSLNNEFKGLIGYKGKVNGITKVILKPDDLIKVNKGDIIIASMTRPDYIFAMKKAGAVVTDEGGITSHAAIVCREMGIPCIVGSKVATQVLNDGDYVEVNADLGVVRILERAK